MSSLLKTNSISAATGSTVTIPSGTTLDIASGATIDATGATITGWPAAVDNTPAFQAYQSANLYLPDNTFTAVTANTEDFDSDSAYDTSTHTFTVPSGEGGKYFLYFYGDVESGGGSAQALSHTTAQIRINSESSSTARFSKYRDDYTGGNTQSVFVSGVVILSAADTVKFWVKQNV